MREPLRRLGRFAASLRENPIHDVGCFGGDREAPSIAQVIRARVERRVGRQHGRGGDEIGGAARAVFRHELYQTGGGLDAFPLNAGFAGDRQAGLQALRRREDLAERLGLCRIVVYCYRGENIRIVSARTAGRPEREQDEAQR